MKRIKQYIGLAAALLLAGTLNSCIKDDVAPAASSDMANVTVKLDSRATDTTDLNVTPEEGIKTLRLIIVQDGTIVINSKHVFTSATDLLLQQGINIIGLPAKATQFYAVVNEESIDGDFETNYGVGTTFEEPTFNATTLTADANTFPKRDDEIATEGLPMAGKTTAKELSDGQEIEILVTRAVARIDLNITNATGSALQIDRVNFGQFFPAESHLVNATDTKTYQSKSFTEGVSIPTEQTETFTYYLYESNAGSNFTVGLNDNTEFPLTQIYQKDGPTPITELIRNNILSIDATANSSGWELQCNVKPWDVEDVTIDFKDNLSYSSAGWMEGTYLEQGSDLENNLIHLSPTVPAELKFTIQAPNSATWRAQLTGDVNDIQIVEGFTSGVAYSDGNPVEQTIKVQVTNPDLEDRQPEVILHVFADIAGNTYELDLTDPNKVINPGEETDPINRFTLIQAQ